MHRLAYYQSDQFHRKILLVLWTSLTGDIEVRPHRLRSALLPPTGLPKNLDEPVTPRSATRAAERRQKEAHGVRGSERISQPVILSEAKDLALPMELADGEGTQSEILRLAQNDSACIFLPFADLFAPSYAMGFSLSALRASGSGQ